MSDEMADFSGVLRKHLMDEHDFSGTMIAAPSPDGYEAEDLERKVTTFSGLEQEDLTNEAKTEVSEVTQFKKDRGLPTEEEEAVTTFSGVNKSKSSTVTKELVRDVELFKSSGDMESRTQCFIYQTNCQRLPAALAAYGGIGQK
jgi:hypothetical protein